MCISAWQNTGSKMDVKNEGGGQAVVRGIGDGYMRI